MKSQQVIESLSKDRSSLKANIHIHNQLRKHSITPVRQMAVNKSNGLSQMNVARSRAVSQAQNYQFDELDDDTIQSTNQQNYDPDKDSHFKSAINTVYIQLSTKNGKVGFQDTRPCDGRDTSQNKTDNAQVSHNRIFVNNQNQRIDNNETEFSKYHQNDFTRKLSGVYNQGDIPYEQNYQKKKKGQGSPVLSTSSIETIKQENKIQLNTRNKTDLVNLKQNNNSAIKNIKKIYAGLKMKDNVKKYKNKNLCMSSPQIEPCQPQYNINNQSQTLYDKVAQVSSAQVPIISSPRERAIREVQWKSKYKSGSYEDYENKQKNKKGSAGNSVFSQKNQKSNNKLQNEKEYWIKTQNLQNLMDFNNNANNENIIEKRVNVPPKLIPKSTQNKMNKRAINAMNNVDQLTQVDFTNKISFTQNDFMNNIPSPTYHDQDQSFQEFQRQGDDQHDKIIDTFSAYEPYSTIINKQQKTAQGTFSMKQIYEKDHKKNFHDNLTLLNEQSQIIKQQKDCLKLCKSDFIPCLFIQGNSDKVLLHFHANGEDVGQTQPLMKKINQKLRINIICMEYPGYGLYEEADGLTKKQQRSKQIQTDAEIVFKFIRDQCGVTEDNIIIMGRSIGSGPACYLASKFEKARALILISPIKSVKDVARQNYGRIVDLLIEERFDNFQTAKKIKCPVLVYHGLKDTMVPYQHSIEMLIQAFITCEGHMFLRQDMEHNKFDYINDIIRPMKYFFRVNRILKTYQKKQLTDGDISQMRTNGYADKKAIRFFLHLGIVSKSQYFNNFNNIFKPSLPKKNSKGVYITADEDLLPKSKSQTREIDHHIDPLPKPLKPVFTYEPATKKQSQNPISQNSQLTRQDQPPIQNTGDQAYIHATEQTEYPEGVDNEELENRLNALQQQFEEQFNSMTQENNYKTQKKRTQKIKSKQQMQNSKEKYQTCDDLPDIEDSQRIDTNEEGEQDEEDDFESDGNPDVIEVPGLTLIEKKQIRKLLKESIKASIQSIGPQSEDSFLTSSVAINEEFKATLEGKQLMERIKVSNNLQPKQDMSNLNRQLKSPLSQVEEHDVEVPLSFIHIDQQMQNIMSTAPKSKLISSQNETAFSIQSLNTIRDDKLYNENNSQAIVEDESILKKLPGKLMTPFRNQSQDRQITSMKSQIQNYFKNDEPSSQTLDMNKFANGFRIGEQYFRTPQQQIKDTKEEVECCLRVIKIELNKFKSRDKIHKPMLNRYEISHVNSDYQRRENFKSIKSHRLTPNIYLGRDSSRDALIDDLTDYTKQKRSNLSKNIEPKYQNHYDYDEGPVIQNEISEDIQHKSANDVKAYHSTNESQDKMYPQVHKLLNQSLQKQDNSIPKKNDNLIQERITFGDSEKEKILPPQSTNVQTKMNLKNRQKFKDSVREKKLTDLNIVDDDDERTTIWQMIKDGNDAQGVKSKRYFQDLIKLQKKSSMKVQSKNHQSPKLNLTEPSGFEPIIKANLPNEITRKEEVKCNPVRLDTKFSTKINYLHNQKQSISNFMNTTNSEISLPNSMPANKTIEHRVNNAQIKRKKYKNQQSPTFESVNENKNFDIKPKSHTPVKSMTNQNQKSLMKKSAMNGNHLGMANKSSKIKPTVNHLNSNEKQALKKAKNTNKPMVQNFSHTNKQTNGRVNKFKNRFVRPPTSNPINNEIVPHITAESLIENPTQQHINKNLINQKQSPRFIKKSNNLKVSDSSPQIFGLNENQGSRIQRKLQNSKTFRQNSNSQINEEKSSFNQKHASSMQQPSLISSQKSIQQQKSSLGNEIMQTPSIALDQFQFDDPLTSQQIITSPEMRMFKKYFIFTKKKSHKHQISNPYQDKDPKNYDDQWQQWEYHGRSQRISGTRQSPSPAKNKNSSARQFVKGEAGRSLSQLSDTEIDKLILQNKKKVAKLQIDDYDIID